MEASGKAKTTVHPWREPRVFIAILASCTHFAGTVTPCGSANF
jgi:hypothetical protein